MSSQQKMGGGQIKLTDSEFTNLCALIHKQFGIRLSEQKRTLLEGRLQSLLRAGGYDSFQQYYDASLARPNSKGLNELINRVSTNHTFFNREASHFDLLTDKVLAEVKQRAASTGKKEFRLWCAAASTGQEPYLLAMLAMKTFGVDYRNWDAGLLATDISEKALNIAKAGVYTDAEVESLPDDLKKAYTESLGDGKVAIKAEVKKEVLYRRFNLISAGYPFKKPFDVIFCRNVMIYFDQPTKDAVVANMISCLNIGGYLFVGQSESLGKRHENLKFIAASVYQRLS